MYVINGLSQRNFSSEYNKFVVHKNTSTASLHCTVGSLCNKSCPKLWPLSCTYVVIWIGKHKVKYLHPWWKKITGCSQSSNSLSKHQNSSQICVEYHFSSQKASFQESFNSGSFRILWNCHNTPKYWWRKWFRSLWLIWSCFFLDISASKRFHVLQRCGEIHWVLAQL